jgi:pSer/pThr/pTyr-binding forkhead associated (FHA) protein
MSKPIAITCIPLQSTFVKSRGIVIREEETIMIGRAKDGVESENSLQFSTRVVSRKHAEIIYRNGLHIRDTGSSSGTFLNEQRLSSLMQESDLHELHSGDIIRLGDDCILNGGIFWLYSTILCNCVSDKYRRD